MTVSGVTISWVDLAILIVIAVSVLAGLTQGFFRSVFSLGGLILGLALAEWNYPLVAAPMKPLVHDEQFADILAFLLIAVLVMAVATLIGAVLAKTFKTIGLGCLDRLAGAVFGFFQGVLLVTLTILVTVAFYPQAHWLVEAKLPRHFFAALHLSADMSTGQLAGRLRSGLRLLEDQTPEWMHPNQNKP
jgi:membrane protein required for colicin V production